jgi:eukaryotic-like serine/threonine-protein kinase
MSGDTLPRIRSALEGHYRVTGEIGAGGMSTVYSAEDVRHGRTVAIKVLLPELAESIGAERFLREIEVTAGLVHPNILPLLDSGEADGLLYYVMPFIEGESLGDRLKREPQLPLDDAVAIGGQVAAALNYAHERGIVHRDIKPANILLHDGQAMVADFGIAKAVTMAGGQALTSTGLSIGTPLYMSPEQIDGAKALDGRADVYSLGCVLYHMLVGEVPFTGPSSAAIMARHAVDPAAPLTTVRPELPKAVDRAVQKALAKSPADRFASTSGFADALEKAGGLDPHEERRKARRARRLAAGFLAVAVAAIGWLGFQGPGAAPMRVAVLPVELQGEEEQAYLASGIHSALITELGQIGMFVVGRRSVSRYRDGALGIREIAEDLGVDALVEAEVFPLGGDELRIVARLVDGQSEGSLWNESFEARVQDIISISRAVASGIARVTRLRLTEEAEARLAESSAVDPGAYRAVLQARYLLGNLTPAGLDSAQVLFEQALALDPEYAGAHLGIAEVWTFRRQMGIVPPYQASPLARVAAQNALRYDSLSAAVQAYRASAAAWEDWDWETADAAFRHALTLDPGDARTRAFYGHLLVLSGRPEESRVQADSALALDPGDHLVGALTSGNYMMIRDFGLALSGAQATLDIAPGHPIALLTQRIIYQSRGEDSLAFAATRAELAARRDTEQVEALDQGFAGGGYHEAMREAAAVLQARGETEYVAPAQIYELYLGAEMYEEAIEWIERAFDTREAQLPYISVNPMFDPVRDDPRVQRIIRRMQYPGA